jgi:D-alanyl-D-alanine carboxypeptidase
LLERLRTMPSETDPMPADTVRARAWRAFRSPAIGLALAALSTLASACSASDANAPPLPGHRSPENSAPEGEPSGETPGSVDPTPDPFEKPPPPLALPQPAIDAAAAAVRTVLARAAYTRSVRVENGTTGQTVVVSTPERLLKPASNTKLFTTGAALELLGEDHGMALRAYGTAAIGANGTLAGDLYVLSEHNFTASPQFYPGAREPFDRLAQALRRRGLQNVTGAVRLTGEIIYNAASSVQTLNVAAQRTSAAAPLGQALTAAGITHGGVTTAAALAQPAGATLLVEYAPMPIVVGASPINVLSHNEFADLLSRHLGWKVEGQSSYAGGGKVMIDWLSSLKIPTAGIAFNDGSGLSHDNRVSADATVAMMRAMNTTPAGPAWKGTMAIAGVRGTLRGRLTGDETRGRVFAKTGTLRDTIALSGYLENRYDGHEYLISILQNAVADQATARAIADDVVRVIARNHRESGARLPAPALARVRGVAAKGLLEMAWEEVEGAEGYLVWLSADGRTWDRDDARFVRKTRFMAGDLPDVPVVYVRITARDAAGLESDPSTTFAASPSKERPSILLVDANQRWLEEPQPENVLVQNHDFLVSLASSSSSRLFDSVRREEIAGGSMDLSGYRAIVWAAGETSVAHKPVNEAEQAALKAYLETDGAVLFSGSELLWSFSSPRGSDSDVAFASQVLRAGFVADDAGTFEFEGAAGSDFERVPVASFFTPDAMRVETPDVLAPAGGSVELLRYVGGAGGAAAVGYKGKGRVVVTGFPVESIASGVARKSVLDAAYTFLGAPAPR